MISFKDFLREFEAAEPLLGEAGKKKKKEVKEGGAPADTPIRFTNSKSDTGFALEGGKKKK